jgi:hypothetical protein
MLEKFANAIGLAAILAVPVVIAGIIIIYHVRKPEEGGK